MIRLPAREVHLDFHTSPDIMGVGSMFDKKQFQKMLLKGHVNSMTVFAKGHHGYCYYPTKVGTQHPGMQPGFDLTGAMIDACHEIGVRAPVYITLGWSAHDAEMHPEWIARNKDGSYSCMHYDFGADAKEPKPNCSWINLCSAGGYRQYLYDLTEEVCSRYKDLDGLFFDIVFVYDACFCDSCRKGMMAEGVNADTYYEKEKRKTLQGLVDILKKSHPGASIFFNSGGADILKPQWHDLSTHYEMEDLPTTWGGYDKMPLRARYFSKSGKEYLGMTGKFHTSWGEFGGYKSKNALKYECACMMANGAKISIGDQMHPLGFLDDATYDLIGSAYSYVESIEPYCCDTTDLSTLAVMVSPVEEVNEGISRLLLDAHINFGVITKPKDMNDYHFIVVPDGVRFDAETERAVNAFLREGNKLILLGGAGLRKERDAFAFETTLKYEGKSSFDVDYLAVSDKLADGMVRSPILCYISAHKTSGGNEVLASLRNPYFNRTYGHYCSHCNTPYSLDEVSYPACVRDGNVTYVAHELAKEYKEYGVILHRNYFENVLSNAGYRDQVKTNLPVTGRVRLVEQSKENRYILHLLYAPTIKRGNVEMIEDLPVLAGITATVEVEKKIKSVCLEPQGKEIPFTQENGEIHFTLDVFSCHQIVVMNY